MWVFLAVLIVLVGAGSAGYWYREPLLAAASLALLPEELKDARVVVVKNRTTTIYARQGTHFVEVPLVDPAVMARMQEARPETGKAAPSLSPDGTEIVFAEAPQNREVRDHDSWSIVLVSAATTTELGAGYAPFFTADGNLGWFTNEGVVLWERATNELVLAHEQVFRDVLVSLRQSPDRRLLAWKDPERETVRVYQVQGTTVVPLARYPDLPAGYALGNEGVYATAPLWEGFEVVRYELMNGASGSRIHWFPSRLPVNALVL